MASLKSILDSAHIAPAIFALRPDYRALLLAISGITPAPSNPGSEALLLSAETAAREQLAQRPVTEIPHIAAWREAYKAFGAKPTKFRNSAEALTRRVTADSGLPRVNRLTDVYNAISVKYSIPIGGEDLDKCVGAPYLARATGSEDFEGRAGGEVVVEHPDEGEVVWCDDKGVTCRRWNWRQGPRTALTADTTGVLFILDALDPLSDGELEAAGHELVEALRVGSPGLEVERRVLRQPE